MNSLGDLIELLIVLAALLLWLCILPTIGILWCVGWLS